MVMTSVNAYHWSIIQRITYQDNHIRQTHYNSCFVVCLSKVSIISINISIRFQK